MRIFGLMNLTSRFRRMMSKQWLVSVCNILMEPLHLFDPPHIKAVVNAAQCLAKYGIRTVEIIILSTWLPAEIATFKARVYSALSKTDTKVSEIHFLNAPTQDGWVFLVLPARNETSASIKDYIMQNPETLNDNGDFDFSYPLDEIFHERTRR